MNKSLEDVVVEISETYKRNRWFTKKEIVDYAREKYPHLYEGQLNRLTIKGYRVGLIRLGQRGKDRVYKFKNTEYLKRDLNETRGYRGALASPKNSKELIE